MKKKIKNLFVNTIKLTLKSLVRVMFLIVTLLLVLAGAVWFTALKYVSAEHIGKEFASALQSALNRPVIVGDFELTSLNSITINNFRIVDTELDEYNEFLSVEKVVIKFDLLPLRDNIIDIKEVMLYNPVVTIIKDESGRTNIPKASVSNTQSALGQQFNITSGEGRHWQVVVEDWVIRNGVFAYRDIAARTSHSLNGIFIRFYNLKFHGFTDFALNFVLRNKIKDKIMENEIVAEGSVDLADFKLSEMTLKDTSLEVRGARQPLKLTLSAKDFLNPAVKFSSVLPDLSYDDVSLYVSEPFDFSLPSTSVNAEISFAEKFAKLKVVSLDLRNKDISLNIKGSADLSAKPIAAEAEFSTAQFNAENADYLGILKPYRVKGALKARGQLIYKDGKFSSPQLIADLNGVSAFISNFTIEGVKGTYKAENNFNDMSADVKDGIFKVGRQTISKIKGTAAYEHKKQNFYAKIKDTMFNNNTVTMSVAISKVRRADRVIKANIYLNLLKPVEIFETTEDFVQALSKHKSSGRVKDESSLAWLRNFRTAIPKFMPNFNGFVYAEKFETPIISGYDFNAEFNLKNMLPGMDKLSGSIDAKLQQGVIYKLQEAADRQKALGIAFQPFVIMSKMERAGSFKMGKILKDTPFEVMTASVDFNNGKMDINNFYVDGEVIAATVGGDVDWVKENLDLDIVTMFKNTSKRGALSENLTDESGEPALAFRVYGEMTKPAVQMKSPKKTSATIKAARDKGLRTDFSAGQKFIKEK